MKTAAVSALALASLLFGPAFADCTYPQAPTSTPDGKTATQEEMVAAMQAIKDYNNEVTSYLECLEKEKADRIAATPNATPDQIAQIEAIHLKRHNAAVEELEAHAARFNEQVKAFKRRGS
jgi:hypothetical protein